MTAAGFRTASRFRYLVIGCALGLAPLNTFAADDLAPTPEQVRERSAGFLSVWNALREGRSGLRVRLEPGLVSSAKYDGARLWWYRVGASAEAGIPVTDDFNVGISPSFAFEQALIKGSDAFLTTDTGLRQTEISDFFDGSLNIGGKYDYNENWGAEVVLRGNVRQESGAEFSDSFQIGGGLAATYQRGQWLRLRLGFGVGADLSDRKPRISPVYRIVLRPIPNVTLETSGLNGTASYDVTSRTVLSLSGGLEGTQYNLEKRTRPPIGLGRGTLQRRQSLMTFGVGHRFKDAIRVRAEIGLVFEQEIAVINSEGIVVDERRDRTPSANGQLRIEFRL